MTILADNQLNHLRPVNPYLTKQVREVDGNKVVSYGVSSYGYDIRLSAQEFYVFQRVPGQIIDPKQFDGSCLRQADTHSNGAFILPGNSYGLGVSVEYISMPRDVTGICMGKSTYARCGIIVNTTPLEAGWKGYLTIEISNSSPSDQLVYPGEGIAQILFFRGETFPTVSYADRKGKYQDQHDKVQTAKI